MIFLLFLSALSADRSKYRACKDSPFCARNRNAPKQNWSLSVEDEVVDMGQYSAPIIDCSRGTDIRLEVMFFDDGITRIRVEPSSDEPFSRFDCAMEPTIMSQKLLSDPLAISKQTNETHTILRSNLSKVVIEHRGVHIYIFHNETLFVAANLDDRAIFETHRDKSSEPSLFETASFGGYHETLKNGPTSVALSFSFFGSGLRISGLPAHTLPMSLMETTSSEPIRFYNTDTNRFEVNSPMSMYGSIPFVFAHSPSESRGLFWCNPSETWVDITGSSESMGTRFVSESGYIDSFIFSGPTPQNVISSYTKLTGHIDLPQQFTFGYHQCRWTYYTSAEIREVTKKLDEALIPHDVLWLDLDHTDNKKYFTFHPQNYKDIDNLEKEFANNKRRLVAQVDPHLKIEDSYRPYSEARKYGYLLKSRDGTTYTGQCWPGRSTWVDFLNPDARDWWSRQFNFSLYLGSSPNLFTWNDMNEPAVFDVPDSSIPRDTLHYNGLEDRDVHNLYGHMMIQATYNGHVFRANEERPFVLTRSYFAGSQKYALMWTGDNTASWEQLKASISLTLSLGICGFPLSGSDVGGFFDSPDSELLTRWYQLGAWIYPFFRCHCHHLSDRREPYTLKGSYFESTRFAIIERYMVLPVWYTAARQSYLTGEPIIRPLWWEFSECGSIEDEAILYNCLLVAPIISKGEVKKKVILPKGRWFDFRGLGEVKGEITFDAKSKFVPVYIRGGKIFAMKPKTRKSSLAMFFDPYTLIVALDEQGHASGDLYTDDGHSFNHKDGQFIHKEYTFDGTALKSMPMERSSEDGFAAKYGVKIDTIKILGIAKIPKEIRTDSGEKLKFDGSNGVIVITKAALDVKKNWILKFI